MTRLSKLIESYKLSNEDMYVDAIQCAVYQEENGNGYVVDVEGAKDTILFDLPCVTACYYWFEDGELKTEAFNYSDKDQHRRHVDTGHHLVYETMYFVPR